MIPHHVNAADLNCTHTGWVVAHTASHHPELAGAIMISSADLGRMGAMARVPLTAFMADNMEALAGTIPENMADDLIANRAQWAFDAAAVGLARMTLLVLTSDDGLAPHSAPLVARVRTLGNTRVTTMHQATDHSWSDSRIALETAVLNWLTRLP